MSYNFGEEFKKNLVLENIKEELEQKDQRIKVLERALELGCDKLQEIFNTTDNKKKYDIYFKILSVMVNEQTLSDYFISQAEKEIKNERNNNV